MNKKLKQFFSHVQPEPNSGCWLWIGATVHYGYGFFQGQGAHRASYAFFKGPLIPGLFICHKCDVTCCVNPDHLFQGTPKENQQDSIRKGRRKHLGYVNDLCPEGHLVLGENAMKNGAVPRVCRECFNRKRREAYVRLNGRGRQIAYRRRKRHGKLKTP